MPEMITYDHAWPATPDTCPPDFDLVAWLFAHREEAIGDGNWRVFHMGTGAHHHVGLSVAEMRDDDEQRNPFHVIGLTASVMELDAYVTNARANAAITNRYTTIFGDIYTFDPRMFVGPLDVATLFHLGEFTDERRTLYGGATDFAVLRRFVRAVRPGGYLIMYPGSMAYDRIRLDVDVLVRDRLVEECEGFRSLRVLRKLAKQQRRRHDD